MNENDRVTWNPNFVARYGDRFPFDPHIRGVIEEVGDPQPGKPHMVMVAWDHERWNPQLHREVDLMVIEWED